VNYIFQVKVFCLVYFKKEIQKHLSFPPKAKKIYSLKKNKKKVVFFFICLNMLHLDLMNRTEQTRPLLLSFIGYIDKTNRLFLE